MNDIQVAQAYFDAWNNYAPAAVVATFAEGGTYSDPTAHNLTGEAIGQMVAGLLGMFPDLSFDIVSIGSVAEGLVAAEWIMRGTNSGPFQGMPPTGKTIALPGSDFIRIAGGKIQSVTGYFDQNAFLSQLGLNVSAVPDSIGPIHFGSSVVVRSGKTMKPGAFSLTWIQAGSEADEGRIGEYSQRIAQEMPSMPGFISTMLCTVGGRGYTITAWENANNTRRMLREGTHKEAMKWFYSDNKTASGMTSVWTMQYAHVMLPCPSCGEIVDADTLPATCECGEVISEHPPYW